MKWSNYQEAIFNDTKHGTGHVIVEALAGSGKSSTLIESLKYVPEDKTWLLVAFNKKIAEELKRRAPDSEYGEVSTLHSLGLKSLGKTFKKITVNNDKLFSIAEKLLPKINFDAEARFSLMKAVSLAKGYLALEKDQIEDVLDEHDADIPDGILREDFIEYIIKAINLSLQNYSEVDFDDMIFFPNVLDVKVPKFDRVFVDEAQDMNVAQIMLAIKACHSAPKTKKSREEGRIVAYLDENQGIYRFRGAHSNTIKFLKEKLNAKCLPLSITYRCPLAVVKEAQKYVPSLEGAPNAIEGKVDYISIEEMKKIAKPGCFILSRTNAPLVPLALSFIKQGVPANIQGRDLGSNLLGLIKKSRCKSLDKFLIWLNDWSKKEVKRLLDRGKDTEPVMDKVECLQALAEGTESLTDLKNNLSTIFADTDDYNKVLLSSIHRAKGMERETVFILASTLRKNNQEELNICYVACTRSKNSLYYVTKAGNKYANRSDYKE